MKKIILSLILILITSSIYAYDCKNFYIINNWSIKDITLQSTLVSMAIIDYCYSLDLIYNPYVYKNGKKVHRYEGNPLIGNPPTRKKMLTFGIISLSLHTYITNLITNKELRTLWQCTFVFIEGINLYKIKQMGLQFHYPWN